MYMNIYQYMTKYFQYKQHQLGKLIWRLLNLASPRGPSVQCTIDVFWRRQILANTQFAKFAKYNSTPKFVDLVDNLVFCYTTFSFLFLLPPLCHLTTSFMYND